SVASVATLTATYNATWAPTGRASSPSHTLSPGSKLHAGDRLTLSAGFAEITTVEGAIAILQAPATIELLDNNNALRLHTGKLVGICETPSSKGFLVRTPHMDVIDLGTRFGVDATQATASKVHVFEGEIQVSESTDGPDAQPTTLTAGQSATAKGQADLMVSQHDPSLRFVKEWRVLKDAPQVEGAIRYLPTMPTVLGFNETESVDILVFNERANFRLTSDTPISLSQPGDGEFISQETLPSGTLVDTYLIHCDILGSDPDKGVRLEGSIRFDRPILGVIVQGEALAQSHQTHGVSGVSYAGMSQSAIPPMYCGLDGPLEPQKQDRFQISDDGLTLTVGLHVSDSIDQVRVFLQPEDH
ncbi:MAG: FecR domain-containing protein, partial [Phycisphaeraceae bacterium]